LPIMQLPMERNGLFSMRRKVRAFRVVHERITAHGFVLSQKAKPAAVAAGSLPLF
jgi:hypothetical protein